MKLFALVSDQGTAMDETTLNAEEFANPAIRAHVEEAAPTDAAHPLRWEDVSENTACGGVDD